MANTVADILVNRLVDWGVRVIFSLPGDGINGIFEALRTRHQDIQLVQVRHEEAAAFAAGPGQAITYQIGKLQIIRMLADTRRTQGPGFSLRAFHDFVWKNGNVPLSLQRWELLGDRSEVDRLAQLR